MRKTWFKLAMFLGCGICQANADSMLEKMVVDTSSDEEELL